MILSNVHGVTKVWANEISREDHMSNASRNFSFLAKNFGWRNRNLHWHEFKIFWQTSCCTGIFIVQIVFEFFFGSFVNRTTFLPSKLIKSPKLFSFGGRFYYSFCANCANDRICCGNTERRSMRYVSLLLFVNQHFQH